MSSASNTWSNSPRCSARSRRIAPLPSSPAVGVTIGAPRKIAASRRTPQNCLRLIPLCSRSDSWTFTLGLSAIGGESNFSRCPLVALPPAPDLLLFAKHLFVEAARCVLGVVVARAQAQEVAQAVAKRFLPRLWLQAGLSPRRFWLSGGGDSASFSPCARRRGPAGGVRVIRTTPAMPGALTQARPGSSSPCDPPGGYSV